MTTVDGRSSDHPVHEIFLKRWSPRAFTGEEIPQADLETILEAARWAPSSYNSQPWRFLYAKNGSANWQTFLDILIPFNQSWAKNASVLIVAVSKSTFLPPGADKEVPSPTHSFDAGAAWGSLALQATLLGWHAHGLAGFDRDKAVTALNVPENHRVEAVIAIGRLGDPSLLPEALAAREKPSGRNALADIAWEGGFPKA